MQFFWITSRDKWYDFLLVFFYLYKKLLKKIISKDSKLFPSDFFDQNHKKMINVTVFNPIIIFQSHIRALPSSKLPTIIERKIKLVLRHFFRANLGQFFSSCRKLLISSENEKIIIKKSALNWITKEMTFLRNNRAQRSKNLNKKKKN